MRSSKNRSRSKGNRNRSVGNIVNRVFDSSGPEGKVRGTPQQIIDKYNQLARDAQLGNDRVAAENFQQHAEHYLRMLAEAQREQEARQQFQPQHGGGGRERGDGEAASEGPAFTYGDVPHQPSHVFPRQEVEAPRQDMPRGDFDAVIDAAPDAETGLVDTPEAAPKAKRSRSRRPKKAADSGQGDDSGDSPQEAAE